MSDPQLPGDVQRPVQQLLTRCMRLRRRAARARVGSNEREKCLAAAQALHACAVLLATDEPLQNELRDTGELSAGSHGLQDAVVTTIRSREKIA